MVKESNKLIVSLSNFIRHIKWNYLKVFSIKEHIKIQKINNVVFFIKFQIYILIRKIIVYLGELIDQKAIHNFDNYMNLIVNRIFIAI